MSARRWLPRFSLRQLLLATALAAVACYALRWASPWWSTVLLYADLAAVVTAALVAINRPGEPRSFWAGFCVCAVLHWVLAFELGFGKGIPPHHPGAFATRWLSAYAYHRVRPQLTVDPIRVIPLRSERSAGGGAVPKFGLADPSRARRSRPFTPAKTATSAASDPGHSSSSRRTSSTSPSAFGRS